MFTTLMTRRFFTTEYAHAAGTSFRAVRTLIIYGAVAISLAACGQKGNLYFAEPSSQTSQSQTMVADSARLDSTSRPQDAAFASIDDDQYQKMRYLEQQQILPEASDDPNDY